MKIDRLLGITCYLLRHGTVSARQLAERFEVSQRTIQRDMVTLSVCGIPITSALGMAGGYAILPTFRMDQLATDADLSSIVVALKALCTASGGKEPEQALEKLLALPGRHMAPAVDIDLSVAREQPHVAEALPLLERAIRSQVCAAFQYEDARGKASERLVEPLLLRYQWYAWYLFAYDVGKAAYRSFKLARMREVRVTERGFSKTHGDPEELLAQTTSETEQKATLVRLKCQASVRVAVSEYLKGNIREEWPGGDFLLETYMPGDERMWWGLLLSFGDAVTVLSPDSLAERLRLHAEKIAAQYAK